MQKRIYTSLIVLALIMGGATTVFAGAQEEALAAVPENSRYVEYDEAAFAAATNLTRIYFFHAGWCPSCRSLDQDIASNLEEIPQDVLVFKIDYDSSDDLKTQYGVTYQHTLVVVDADGELVRKWTGGDFQKILDELAEI